MHWSRSQLNEYGLEARINNTGQPHQDGFRNIFEVRSWRHSTFAQNIPVNFSILLSYLTEYCITFVFETVFKWAILKVISANTSMITLDSASFAHLLRNLTTRYRKDHFYLSDKQPSPARLAQRCLPLLQTVISRRR
jgi:hypothetical protein